MSTVKDVEKIDLITYNESLKQVVLVIIESRKWCNDESMYEELNEKFNNYLSFVEDGQLSEAYKNIEIESVKFELLYSFELNDHAKTIVDKINEYLLANNYLFEHRIHDT
jgi:hypothetical protein